ncbi:MAG: hypothetical protein AAF631_12925 [Pseudomonadota bacterium]
MTAATISSLLFCVLTAPVVVADGGVRLEGQRDPPPFRLELTDEFGEPRLRLDLPLPVPAPGVDGLPSEARAGRETRAITGARLLFTGREVGLAGVSCPPPGTKNGREARALLNTFLRRAGSSVFAQLFD